MDNSYAAFCLDSAVAEFGNAVEAELKRVEGKTQKEIDVKSDRTLRKWLDMPLRYREPNAMQLPKRAEDS